ncbi:probable arginine--tRNA ligase, mitochondrial isoform X2 [Leptopilina heterotoma]|uniref:probable arginine--tRNA ligase, mitochondrial isoform X1 n=1 Tax=Leptopilina heterotoma TaxID=63436 RepID=UPI001CA9B8FF|nr:probable arginine--tRNA ligase, mitochondrial isoform X1 [Leptopilina heterotoma]XP_043484213.1 probable arginine--tRNA ligase, mitochondrial isoform X2 [Leptopilina heterotoma]
MSCKVRQLVHKKVAECLHQVDCVKNVQASNLKLKHNVEGGFSFKLPLKNNEYDVLTSTAGIINNTDNYVKNIEHGQRENNKWMLFQLHRDPYVKNALENNAKEISPPVNQDTKKIVVEFSSPNIAKPFHVGHLRSTIIGNFIANVNQYLNNNVTKINYLGDWGTQFGFIQIGRELGNISQSSLKSDPMNNLYKAYVHANNLSLEDPSLLEKAKDIFRKLEEGDDEILKDWEILRRCTADELKNTYGRLGVTFDEYHWESMYNAKKLKPLIANLEQLKLLTTDSENRKVICINEKNVPLLKSDGTTLYLIRDIAAAVDRFNEYEFDSMFYVVDNSQSEHFSKIKKCLELMQYPWSNRIEHVKFGKIRGMSTRKGTAVFLTDILDETRLVMREKQMQSPNTKVSLDVIDESTDILGVSAVIINDLKQKRNQDYNFDWNKALDFRGETGVKLQYTHCRLESLIENNDIETAVECNPEILNEAIVDELVLIFGLFDEMLLKSHEKMEACIFVNYLFRLSHVINKCVVSLRVKDESPEIAAQRLLLFKVAKNFLAQGMKLVGLTPLKRM